MIECFSQGDSAGLINPFFGDGILHALKSGQIAARCILEKTQHDYTRAIGREFKTNFDAALKLSKFFYQWPKFATSMVFAVQAQRGLQRG